jgi:hypothetical protein
VLAAVERSAAAAAAAVDAGRAAEGCHVLPVWQHLLLSERKLCCLRCHRLQTSHCGHTSNEQWPGNHVMVIGQQQQQQ